MSHGEARRLAEEVLKWEEALHDMLEEPLLDLVENAALLKAFQLALADASPALSRALLEALEENKELREAAYRACVRFFGEGTDGQVANEMRLILEEAK